MTNTQNTNTPCPNCAGNDTVFFANASDIEYFTSDNIYQYRQCKNCGVLFLPPPLPELPVIYPENYYAFTNQKKGLAQSIKNKLDSIFFLKQLKNIPGRQLKVLDIGGGTGWLSDTLKRTDSRIDTVQVVDIDPAAAEEAEKKGYSFFCGKIEAFHTNENYDIILMLNLIEHVANPEALIARAAGMLTPHGSIIIKTPNYKSLDARLFRKSNWGGYHCPRHWVIFDKKSLTTLVQKQGLQIAHFSYTQGAPFWTVGILYKLLKLNWIKADARHPLVYHPLFGMISMLAATFDFIRKPFAPLSQMFFVLKKNSPDNS